MKQTKKAEQAIALIAEIRKAVPDGLSKVVPQRFPYGGLENQLTYEAAKLLNDIMEKTDE